MLVPGQDGRIAVGLEESRGLLFVAGGPTGRAYVYDAHTGTEVASLQLDATDGSSFVNDVTVTPKAAWFTDSAQAVLCRVPLKAGAGRACGHGPARRRLDPGRGLQHQRHRVHPEWVGAARRAQHPGCGLPRRPDTGISPPRSRPTPT